VARKSLWLETMGRVLFKHSVHAMVAIGETGVLAINYTHWAMRPGFLCELIYILA
jgi:hypothetical protein